MGLLRRKEPTKHDVRIEWGIPGNGNVIVNGMVVGSVSYAKEAKWGCITKPKPIGGIESPASVEIFHPLSAVPELRRQGIATAVHGQLEEEILRSYPKTDALIAIISRRDSRLTDRGQEPDEALERAVRFYKSVGYKVHHDFWDVDLMEDDPTLQARMAPQIGRYVVMVKKLRTRRGARFDWSTA